MKLSEESKDFLDKNPAGKIEDLPNEIKGVFENTFEVAEKVLQHKKIIERWKPIMESLGVKDQSKIELLSTYAENITQRDIKYMTDTLDEKYQNYLPTALYVMSKLDNEIEFTTDPAKVKNYVFDFKLDIEEVSSFTSPDTLVDYTNKSMITELSKYKKLLVYDLINNIELTREVEKTDEENVFLAYARLRVMSRIEVEKIN
jgi:hypothetical protein